VGVPQSWRPTRSPTEGDGGAELRSILERQVIPSREKRSRQGHVVCALVCRRRVVSPITKNPAMAMKPIERQLV
jgi:hypothetical protein